MSKKSESGEIIAAHEESFAKEAKLRSLYAEVSQVQKALCSWGKFMEVTRIISPELCTGAIER